VVRRSVRREATAAQLELERLEGLPCGCVVAVQRARPSLVRFVSIEAKGPHCSFASHRTDRVLRIGDPTDRSDSDDDSEFDDEPADM
jgi:hypothetical protein